ncbi:hypothetical protein CA264_04315 [Pontibacter actiniarum]|uniref:Uncharacterized protein n=3 Tax=Pontibacter actiniarum TaxID=323450 RepID=A0A1X9YP98_9BACT|nr:hypothetical protein CA264_04315 [Pontibacter actiniarum]
MLKSRFKKKLYNHLRFLDLTQKGYKQAHVAMYQCSTLLTEAFGLRALSELKLSVKVLEQALRVATEHEVVSMKVRILEEMKLLYFSLSDYKNYNRCSEQLRACYAVENCEREALLLYESVMLKARSGISERSHLFESLPGAVLRLEQLWQQSGSSLIFYYFNKLSILYLEQTGQYAEIAEEIARAEVLVKEGKVNSSWYSVHYNLFIKIYALLQSRQYSVGLMLAKEYQAHFRRFSTNWFAFMENYLLLTLHNKDYEQAAALLQDVTSEDHMAKLQANSQERWELYRRFYTLVAGQAVKEAGLDAPFISDLAILSRDKSGFNLAILILDVLSVLPQADLEQQAERVRKYRVKYLKGEKAERPRLFLRLLQVALQEQEARAARERGEKLLVQLEASPLPGDAFTEVEIVPYEHLWELVLKLLQQREQK